MQMDMFDLPSVEVSRLWDNTFELCQDYVVGVHTVDLTQTWHTAYTSSQEAKRPIDKEELYVYTCINLFLTDTLSPA